MFLWDTRNIFVTGGRRKAVDDNEVMRLICFLKNSWTSTNYRLFLLQDTLVVESGIVLEPQHKTLHVTPASFGRLEGKVNVYSQPH